MSSREELLKRLPREGFLKITASQAMELPDEKRIALIRRGNELFNEKKLDLAERIFLTTGYSDGLIRLGDLYLKQGSPLQALRMYLLAPERNKVDALLERTVQIVQKWLKEEKENVGDR
jgi:hypothetical protein